MKGRKGTYTLPAVLVAVTVAGCEAPAGSGPDDASSAFERPGRTAAPPWPATGPSPAPARDAGAAPADPDAGGRDERLPAG